MVGFSMTKDFRNAHFNSKDSEDLAKIAYALYQVGEDIELNEEEAAKTFKKVMEKISQS